MIMVLGRRRTIDGCGMVRPSSASATSETVVDGSLSRFITLIILNGGKVDKGG